MFRGLALVMIFINHVPGTVFEAYTNRNFGFSDAAEAFVFMSGVAAGLAYSLPQLHAMRHQILGLGTAQVLLTTALVAVLLWLAGQPPVLAFVVGAVFVLLNMVSDMLYRLLDPRARG